MSILLTGCGSQNESALTMNTIVTNEVTNQKNDIEPLMEETTEQEMMSDTSVTTSTKEPVKEITQDDSSLLEEDTGVDDEIQDSNNQVEDPIYGHYIRHSDSYVDESVDAIIPMDMYYSYDIPDNYEESIIDGVLVYSSNLSNKHTLFVYTESASGISSDDILANYDVMITEAYGDKYISGEEEYNDMVFNHYRYDINDNGYHVYANIYTYADDKAGIYIEFYDTASTYDDMIIQNFMESIQKSD